MMRGSIIAFVYATIFVVLSNASHAQCCSVGAGFSSLPASLQNSALESGNLLAVGSNNKYTYFKEYYIEDRAVENGLTQEQKTITSTLSIMKSLFTDFLIQADISYIPYFYQDNGLINIDKSALSDIKFNIGYSFLRNYDDAFFSQVSAGFKIPLEEESDDIISYERGYSISLMSSSMKRFDDIESILALVFRYEHFLSETNDKQTGDNYFTSVMYTKILNDWTLSAELNFLTKGRDDLEGVAYNDSGHSVLQFSPQFGYLIGNFIVGMRYDLPIYKYYKKYQITPSYSISLNLNYIF